MYDSDAISDESKVVLEWPRLSQTYGTKIKLVYIGRGRQMYPHFEDFGC